MTLKAFDHPYLHMGDPYEHPTPVNIGGQPSLGTERPATVAYETHHSTAVTADDPHPAYGPCDGFGPDGECSECAKARFTTHSEWIAWLQRKQPAPVAARDIDVDPADDLLQQLAATEDAWAEGAGWYGEHGRYSEQRDILLAAAGERIKLAWPETPTSPKDKYTEAAVERMAKADAGYKAFVDAHLERRIAWLKLNEERTRLWAEYWRLHAEAKNARFAGAA